MRTLSRILVSATIIGLAVFAVVEPTRAQDVERTGQISPDGETGDSENVGSAAVRKHEAVSLLMGVIENRTRDARIYFTLSGIPEYTLDPIRKRRFDPRHRHKLDPGESLSYFVSSPSVPPASISIVGGIRPGSALSDQARQNAGTRHALRPGQGYALIEEGSSVEGPRFAITEMPPGNGKPDPHTLAVMSLRNPTDLTIQYHIRWSHDRPWHNYTIEPGERIWLWSGHRLNALISFDHSPKPGYQGQVSPLQARVFRGITDPDFVDGEPYVFQRTPHGLTLRSERPVITGKAHGMH